jgi:3-oxoadipate enol-lactonase
MPLHHRLDGPDDAPVLVLAPSLGTTLALWEPQLAALAGPFRVLRIDHRGHGDSPLPPEHATVEGFADDLVALLDELGIGRVSLCGLSLGGALCLTVAARAPARVERLVLACCGPRFGEPAQWSQRARTVRADGMGAIADTVVARWFTEAFQRRAPDVVSAYAAMVRATPPEGYARCCEAVGRYDARDLLGRVRAPTTVLTGRHDPVSGPPDGELLATGIAGARLVLLDAAHLANVEQPQAFSDAVLDALAGRKDAA